MPDCDCPLGTVHRCGVVVVRDRAIDRLRQASADALAAYERYLESIR